MREGEIGGAVGLEFEADGGKDEGGGDGPEVVLGPAEADYYEELGVLVSVYVFARAIW